jgi:ADP-heptose:LPS heptosyltransferase
MHLASGFGVPILCLYGPTYPEGAYGPIHGWVRNEQLQCLVCNLLHCPIDHPCMRQLPLEAVQKAFRRMMEKGMQKEERFNR